MAVLSIVLPAYNEEQNIANTVKVLSEILEQNKIDYELVFISDGSRDGTYAEIVKAAADNPRVKGAEFSRNFGKEAGIFAGTGTVPGPVWRYDAGRLFWPALGMGAQGRRRRAFVIQDGQAAIRF